MAKFDQDPRIPAITPANTPGVSGVSGPTETPLERSGVDPGPPSGDFTKLFGKPPKPEPLEGMGTSEPAAGATAETPANAEFPNVPATSNTSAASSFTLIFGSSPLGSKEEPVSPEPLHKLTADLPTKFKEGPVTEGDRMAASKSDALRAGSFTSLFVSPAGIADAETGAAAIPKDGSSDAVPTIFHATPEPRRGTSSFTMMFGNPTRPAVAPGVPEALAETTLPTTQAIAASSKQEPKTAQGAFTQFFGTPAQPIVHTLPQSPVATDATAVPHSASPEEFANIFDFPLRDSSSIPEPEPANAPSDFTSMFSPRPASVPAPGPAATDSGSFSKLFNSPVPSAAQTPQPTGGFNKLFSEVPTEERGASFTGIFGSGDEATNSASRPTSYPQRGRSYPISGQEEASSAEITRPMAGWSPATPGTTPSSTPSSGATQIFTRPGDGPAPASPTPPAGPSAFTQVVSRDLVREMTKLASAQAAQPPSVPSFMQPAGFPGMPIPPAVSPIAPGAAAMPPFSTSLPTIAQPPATNMPGMWSAPAPMPQMPAPYVQYPHMQLPQAQMAQPPMPQPPALAAAPPRTNWLPVIIGANVFVLIVVILILIFALRK